MDIREIFDVVDMHAGGEPLRIITSGYPAVEGVTVLDKRERLKAHWDHYRKMLMFEPWGHEDMYGCLLVEPERRDSQYGLIFMHNEGYSSMCGHAVIAVTKMLVETGRVAIAPGADEAVVRFDVPSGLVVSHARLTDGQVVSVWFENVPAYAAALDTLVRVDSRELRIDVGFGGAFYAILDAAQLGCTVEPEMVDELRDWAARIKGQVEPLGLARHPGDPRLDGLYGVVFTDTPHDSSHFSRNLTVFADGQVDRSPCGSCVSARLAVLYAKGMVKSAAAYPFESVVDTVFVGQVLGNGAKIDPHQAVRTVIEGQAHFLGFRRFYGNPHDSISPFLIR